MTTTMHAVAASTASFDATTEVSIEKSISIIVRNHADVMMPRTWEDASTEEAVRTVWYHPRKLLPNLASLPPYSVMNVLVHPTWLNWNNPAIHAGVWTPKETHPLLSPCALDGMVSSHTGPERRSSSSTLSQTAASALSVARMTALSCRAPVIVNVDEDPVMVIRIRSLPVLVGYQGTTRHWIKSRDWAVGNIAIAKSRLEATSNSGVLEKKQETRVDTDSGAIQKEEGVPSASTCMPTEKAEKMEVTMTSLDVTSTHQKTKDAGAASTSSTSTAKPTKLYPFHHGGSFQVISVQPGSASSAHYRSLYTPKRKLVYGAWLQPIQHRELLPSTYTLLSSRAWRYHRMHKRARGVAGSIHDRKVSEHERRVDDGMEENDDASSWTTGSTRHEEDKDVKKDEGMTEAAWIRFSKEGAPTLVMVPDRLARKQVRLTEAPSQTE